MNPRNSSEHKNTAKCILEESNPVSQQRLCSELGARYSVFQELEYFECIRYFVVDPTHNMWLNEKNEFLRDEDFQRIKELVDSMTVPQDIGRIPGKISSKFLRIHSRSMEKLEICVFIVCAQRNPT